MPRIPRSVPPPRVTRRALLAGAVCFATGISTDWRAGAVQSPAFAQWVAGFRPRASDGLPVLGASERINGLFYATGHFRNGILLAPITGELIADEIIEGTRSSLLEPFSSARLCEEIANRAF